MHAISARRIEAAQGRRPPQARKHYPTRFQYPVHCLSYKQRLLPSARFTSRREDVSGIERPNHQDYREEAWRIRAVAVGVKNTHARVQLLLIASLYEKLAEHARCDGNALSDNLSWENPL
jgi:hypothetical protein